MTEEFRVVLTAELIGWIETRSLDDQDVLLGFVEALRLYGLDVVTGRDVASDPGFVVEFIEPGETPDMVWIRLFLDLADGALPLTVRRDERMLYLSGS